MKTPREIQDLVADVAHNHPSAQLELDPLPSGVCFFWVTLGGRQFVIEHDPKRGTGVSENLPATPPFVGHDQVLTSLTEAINKFRQMLVQAEHGFLTSAA